MVFKLLKKVKDSFKKTGTTLSNKLLSLFRKPLTEQSLEDLEKTLYEADLGIEMAEYLTEAIRKQSKQSNKNSTEDYLKLLKQLLIEELQIVSNKKEVHTPLKVILVVGINGSGKTTSIAKLTHWLQTEEKASCILGAADTFRAAAIDQLQKWAKHLDTDIVLGKNKGDPAAVAFDTVQAAHARKCQYALIDTAGRLHNKVHLMQELNKIKRSCQKVIEDAPHEVLLILDANLGQNSIDQALEFNKYTPLSGLILTKMDGSAKGGTALAIQRKLKIPIKYIGTGEKLEDFAPFDIETYVHQLIFET